MTDIFNNVNTEYKKGNTKNFQSIGCLVANRDKG